MKKIVMSIAAAGLLLSAGAAFSQNATVQKDAPAQAAPTTTAPSAPATTKAAPATPRSGTSAQMGDRREGENRGGDRSERRERGERGGINIRVGGGDRDGYRHRRGYGYAQYGARCRIMIVKSYRHGHRVIKRIRRCW